MRSRLRLFVGLAAVHLCLWLSRSVGYAQEQKGPFSPLELSREARDIRQSLIDRKYRLAAHLLSRASRDDSANRAMALGMDAATKELVDPLTLITSTHDFHEPTGAFIQNGEQDTIDYFDELVKTFLEIDAKSAPHIADALCLGIANQLDDAIDNGIPIAISDSVLLSKSKHTKVWDLGKARQFAVIVAESADRQQFTLKREMFHSHVGRQAKHFFMTGPWRPIKGMATKADPQSITRWDAVYRDLAIKCGKKARFTSGMAIVIFGTKGGLGDAWDYLNAMRKMSADKKDEETICRLKIAFAYTCELHRVIERPLPIGNDGDFDETLRFLRAAGSQVDTKHMLEIAGIDAAP